MFKIENPEHFRENVKNEFSKALSIPESDAALIEKSIFKFAKANAMLRKVVRKWDNPLFVSIYIDRWRSIFTNVANDASFLQTVDVLEDVTHQRMLPEKWGKLIEKQTLRTQSKFKNTQEASTDIFTCRKCGSKKCTYYQLQTRSGDESMTTFVSCVDCPNRWKC